MTTWTRAWLPAALSIVAVAALPAAAGLSHHSLVFRGSHWAEIPHHPSFDAIETSDAVTVEAWIRIDAFTSGWFSVIDKYEKKVDFGWTFQIDGGGGSTNSLQFVGGIGPTARATWVAPIGNWTHVAMSYRRSDGFIRFYVDGQLLEVVSYSADIQDTSGEPLYLGYNPSGGDEYSVGAIDELRIWDHPLSDAEIRMRWRERVAGDEPGLVGYWRFDEGSGKRIGDTSPSANDGSLMTAPHRPRFGPGAPLPETH